MTISLNLKPVKSIREMIDKQTKKRKLGLLYFHLLKPDAIVAHVISETTDAKWLELQIISYKIYLPEETTIVEPS